VADQPVATGTAAPTSGELPERITIQTTVNGRPVTLEIDPWESLATALRTSLGLTGTKISCDVQACGACTVLVDGLPRSACTYLAYEARGRDVLTVEGLETPDGTLTAIQAAFIAESAFQCGFCTPGMLLATHALISNEDADDDAIIEHMTGNLCRCTGYLPILAAVLRARAAAAGGTPIDGRDTRAAAVTGNAAATRR
jgi:aerobic-type carbon monoxide dehydrogenase small subunit (CoxS/CutS family)